MMISREPQRRQPTGPGFYTPIDLPPAPRPEQWWITTGLEDSGKKLLGPFETRDLALSVRTYMEMAEAPASYWVEQVPAEGRRDDGTGSDMWPEKFGDA